MSGPRPHVAVSVDNLSGSRCPVRRQIPTPDRVHAQETHKCRVNFAKPGLLRIDRHVHVCKHKPVALCLGGVVMTPKFSVGALVGALILATSFWSYPANALTFQFSFTNVVADGGTVVGIVSGLLDNQTSPALSVQVTSNTGGFGVGEYVGHPNLNSFQVTAGNITAANFFVFGQNNTAPDVTCCGLALGTTFSLLTAGLTNSPSEGSGDARAGLTFTAIAIAETPLPAALPLFAGGLGALGLLGWRRKKKAAALTA